MMVNGLEYLINIKKEKKKKREGKRRKKKKKTQLSDLHLSLKDDSFFAFGFFLSLTIYIINLVLEKYSIKLYSEFDPSS